MAIKIAESAQNEGLIGLGETRLIFILGLTFQFI